MEKDYAYRATVPLPSGKSGWALLASGMWLRLAFAGASALVAGLLQLLQREGPPAFALALTLGGAAVAAISWQRARTALDRAEALPNSPSGVDAASGLPAATRMRTGETFPPVGSRPAI